VNEVTDEYEHFISKENEELKRIRQRKLAELKEKKPRMSDGPIHLTDSNFNNIIKKHHVALIDFWAPWCGPCQSFGPTIEEVNKEYAEKILVGKLNVDENPKTAESYKVLSIPTILIMKNAKEVDRIVGCVPKKDIESALRKQLG
jgi:thioredoxin 1